MKLYYYQRRDGQPNFGDELNHWLWPRLLPHCFDADVDGVFVGTGTLLNARLPERLKDARRAIFLGTGAGYEQPLKKIPDSWNIYCVRGPLSARQLQLPASKAVADGGILVSRVFTKDQPKCDLVSFMPHVHHANYAAELWQAVCQQAGIHYIDPRWAVERVLHEISQSQLLLAEAMHGAIVADALRVPWIPLVTSSRILAFKWHDWCKSVKLAYRPQFVPPLAAYPRWGRGIRSGKQAVIHWGQSVLQQNTTAVQSLLSFHPERLTQMLRYIAEKGQPSLSDDQVLSARLSQLEDYLSQISKKASARNG